MEDVTFNLSWENNYTDSFNQLNPASNPRQTAI